MEASQISPAQPFPPPAPPLPPPPPALSRLLPPPPSLQRRSMKKLNWDTIPNQRVLGKVNVWTSALPPRELVLDTHSMDELFSHVDRRAQSRAGFGRPRRGGSGSADVRPSQPQVSILDAKKSMNIGIFLRHFKRPAAEMLEDIVRAEWRGGADGGKLTELCKLLPEESEVKRLLSFSGNPSLLSEADRFMVQLVKVPRYEELLKTMVLRQEFSPLMEEASKSLAVMIQAANELLDCDKLHAVIRLVLKAGNYMNAGGYSADAIGFRMTSLLKLADTKANKPAVNLLHYVAKQAEDIDADLLTFPSQLEHIGTAARVCQEEVLADLERQVKKLKEVKLCASRHPHLHRQMAPFLKRCDDELCQVKSLLHELDVLSFAVAEFFCEDPQNFKLEECCAIFHSFCRRFVAAVQENREREAAERRRKSRESVRLPAKRSPAPPAPHSSLESALHSFLSAPSKGASAGRSRKNSRSPAPPERPPGNQETAQESPEKKHAKVDEDGEKSPSTPRPRTRDVFFANNGDVGSPWTILSPLTCSRQRRRGASDAEGPDDGVWESTSGGPRGRSASAGSARPQLPPLPTAAAAFRLGTLFQRAATQRSYSSGAAPAGVGNPAGSFGFISFFRRFGGKREAEEEPGLRGRDT
ncbi:FH2 domain-containing protein 1-like [Hippocampus comes]|uniref:FH2 domain containing 3 n=1 Tax=Hippocampus comes TaxID=109280 RepID=A0A3Q3DYP1_HIPCM|nr:PREDICTED: FH2 domain-containing protein 1-like [Hippocampus comes]XP_019727529.1 PREDICTED: FH2 domain-containing protein 1-like [Hippocampus comes]